MQKTKLDPEIFPYLFDCPDCPYGSSTKVTHRDVTDLPPYVAGPTVRHAVNEALRSKGWGQINGQWMCAKCVQDIQ
jgi:hypothetical protein